MLKKQSKPDKMSLVFILLTRSKKNELEII